jgi:hypothetical protein
MHALLPFAPRQDPFPLGQGRSDHLGVEDSARYRPQCTGAAGGYCRGRSARACAFGHVGSVQSFPRSVQFPETAPSVSLGNQGPGSSKSPRSGRLGGNHDRIYDAAPCRRPACCRELSPRRGGGPGPELRQTRLCDLEDRSEHGRGQQAVPVRAPPHLQPSH